jgi:hypothetical protein
VNGRTVCLCSISLFFPWLDVKYISYNDSSSPRLLALTLSLFSFCLRRRGLPGVAL